MDSMQALNLVKGLIDTRSVFRSPPHRLISPSGRDQSWMIDLRPVLLSSTGLEALAFLFWSRFEQELPFQIGGMEMAAVPLVAAILMVGAQRGHNVGGFIVRKERKPHGRMQGIENDLSELPILIVDDIFNSGTSLEKVRAVLADSGRHIWRIWSVIDFGAPAGLAWKRLYGLEVDSLFGLHDFGLDKTARDLPVRTLQFVERWQHSLGLANHFFVVPKSAPRSRSGRMFIGTEEGELRCIEASSGTSVWTFKTGWTHQKGIRSTPCLADELVVFGCYGGNLYALEASTGREVWRHVEADWIGSSPAWAPELEMIYVGLEYANSRRSGGISALNAKSGQKVWETPTTAFVHCSPVFVSTASLVLCGTNDGLLVALDALDGHIRWSFKTNGAVKYAPAVDVKRQLVVFGSFDGAIRGVDLNTGELRFCVQTGNVIYSTPHIENGRAYCGSTDKQFYVIDLDSGEVLAKIEVQGKIFSPPCRIGDWIWFGATDGRLRALDPVRLCVAGELQLPDAITSEIGYDEDNRLLLIATNAGKLYGVALLPTPLALSSDEVVPVRRNATSLELARLCIDAFAQHTPVPNPAEFNLLGSGPVGGVFVSLRDSFTGHRIARAGQWALDDREHLLAEHIVMAAAKACAGTAANALANVTVGLAVFGPLELVNPGELSTSTTAIAVRGVNGRRIGGALPNSPEYANELGQYLHALRNAGLRLHSPHELYRHTVSKYAESSNWPSFGAPADFNDVASTALAAWLLTPDKSEMARGQALLDAFSGVAVTHYMEHRTATLFIRDVDLVQARAWISETLIKIRVSDATLEAAGAGIVISVLLKGKRLDDAHEFGARSLRIASDALIRVDDDGERIQLPAQALQRGFGVSEIAAKLRTGKSERGSPERSGYWEVCPSQNWLLQAGRSIRLFGAMTDEPLPGENYMPIRGLVHDLVGQTVERILRMTPDCNTYLPVQDRYVPATDASEQFIALISALSDASNFLGMTKWRDIAHAALVEFLVHVENDPCCWERERRSILRGLLMDSTLLLREQSPLVAWATSHPQANDDALELIFALRTAIVRGDKDLRVFVSNTKAGLDKSRALDVMNADLYAECALILVEAGHVELLDGLLTQSNRIVSWQLPSTGAFVPAMSHAGPTAATATLMRALSLAHRVLSPSDQAARTMETVWKNSLQTLMNLRIKPADAFCLRSPQDAIGVFRDALACASASAMSTAAVLGALIHGSLMIVGSSSSDQFSSIHASGFDEPSVEARA